MNKITLTTIIGSELDLGDLAKLGIFKILESKFSVRTCGSLVILASCFTLVSSSVNL